MAERWRLTHEGKVVAVLGVGFFLGALNTGTNLLYLVTGLILAALWVDRRVARGAVAGLRVRRPAPEPGVVGGALVASFEVEAATSAAAPVVVEERLDPAGAALLARAPRALVLELPAGARAVARSSVACRRRGRVRLLGPRLASTGLFGLVEVAREVDLPGEALVLPAVHPLREGLLERPAQATEAIARRLLFTQERRDVVRGLRELRPGDDVRAVHWPSSARRGALLVKEFERTAPRDARVLVHLPSSPGDERAAGAVDAADAAATVAASIVAHLVREGERVALAVAGDGAPVALPLAGGEAVLRRAREALALAAPGEADLQDLERAAPRAPGARTLLVTTRAPRGRPADAHVVVVSGPAEAGRFVRGLPEPAS